MNTMSDLLSALDALDPKLPLVFVTSEGEISPGYHVTELRHSVSRGIDCGGGIETFDQSRLQLLDMGGGQHMSVGKFTGIVSRSVTALPELADAELMVEFGHGNSELRLMIPTQPKVQGDRVVLELQNARAVCKPAESYAPGHRMTGTSGRTSACC